MARIRITSPDGSIERTEITLDGVRVERVRRCTVSIDASTERLVALLEIFDPIVDIEADAVALPHGPSTTEPGERSSR